MTVPPETCLALLVRLRDPADQQAWQEFVETYQPVIFRVARQKGLQPEDADDLVQQVLLAVAKSIDSWEPNPARGRFRTWLNRIASNLTINALTRRGIAQGVGGSDALQRLASHADRGMEAEWLEIEHRRELFRRAAGRIRGEFQPDTWQAFWLTMVDGLTVEETAQRLQKKPGAVYAGRSRVMQRLREVVQENSES